MFPCLGSKRAHDLYNIISTTSSSVTTYDTLIGDFDVIGEVPWRVAVVDEAHRLRNIKGKLLECMKEISAKGTLKYGFQSRVLMTGALHMKFTMMNLPNI